MSEQQIVRTIVDYLALHGIFAWRQNQGAAAAMHKGKKRFIRFAYVDGISDIIGMLPDGRFLAIEVKTARGRPTQHQLAFMRRVQESNGVAGLCRSIEDVDRLLDEAGHPR